MHPMAVTVLVLATIVGLFAVGSAATALPTFFDPCHEWGIGTDSGEENVELDDECPARSGSSQTRGEAVLNLAAIQGVLLLAAGAMIRGATRVDRVWAGGGATLIATLVPPFGLGGLWLLAALMAALVFFAATRFPRRTDGRERGIAIAVTLVGIGLVVVFLASVGATGLSFLAVGIGAAGLAITVMIARMAPPGMEG